MGQRFNGVRCGAFLLAFTFALSANPGFAQERAGGAAPISSEAYKQKIAELQRPRTAVPFDPKQFDAFAGYYQPPPDASHLPYEFLQFTRKGDHYFVEWNEHFASKGTNEAELEEIFPESPTTFFSVADKATNVLSDLFTFGPDAQGNPSVISAGQGIQWRARKVDAATVKAAEIALTERVKDQKPSPGTEGALRAYIASLQNKEPNYDNLTPTVATLARNAIETHPGEDVCSALQSLTFVGVDDDGSDDYQAVFDHARRTLRVLPLTSDGRYAGPALPC